VKNWKRCDYSKLSNICCICLDGHLAAQRKEEEVGGMILVAVGQGWMDAGEKPSAATAWCGGHGRGNP